MERGHAAIANFCLGVMPPSATFGLSLLYVQSQQVAASWTCEIDPNIVCDSQS